MKKQGILLILKVFFIMLVVKVTMVMTWLFLDPCITKNSTAFAARDFSDKSKRVSFTSGKEDCCHPEIVETLRARILELDKREKELDKREKDLDLIKSDIEAKLDELKKLQKKLEAPVKKALVDKENNFNHLVKVYGAMDPARAAVLLDRMDEDKVSRILAAMKSKKVAAIFASMDPVKAARISAMITK